MRVIRKIIFSLILLSFHSTIYAFDWKILHDEAYSKTLEDALFFAKQNPRSIEGMYSLGLVYLRIHNYNEAEKVFNEIIKVNPSTIEAQWGIAEVHRKKHRLSKSEKLLKEIIKINPQFAPAYLSMGYISYVKTDFDSSEKWINRVIKQETYKVDANSLVQAYCLLGGIKGMVVHRSGLLSKITNSRDILPNLKKAEELQSDDPMVLFGLGVFYLLAPSVIGGNSNKALEFLEKAIKADPLFADAYVRLAQVHKMKGDKTKYQFYLRKALQVDPQNELALDIKSGACNFICVDIKKQ